tara:strand:- start:4104 stop:4721 length:618 start_codon:yes stop_codon:yes gene_type:complete
MSVIVDNDNNQPLRIAFCGSTCSGKSTIANLCYNKLVKQKKEVMKLSIAGPIKLIAQKKYGSKARKDWIMIGMEVRAIDENHWINLLKKRIEEFGDNINIIVDDVRFRNEVGILSTLGFKIVHMDIPWYIRFNRLIARTGTENTILFTDTAKYFAHVSELDLLPKMFYDYTIEKDEDKYKLFDIEFSMTKQEVDELQSDKQFKLV